MCQDSFVLYKLKKNSGGDGKVHLHGKCFEKPPPTPPYVVICVYQSQFLEGLSLVSMYTFMLSNNLLGSPKLEQFIKAFQTREIEEL
jgi:hypothetical protein